MQTYLIIISGGSGTRFWPKSTAEQPKQLLKFGPMQRSLLQQTADRFTDTVPIARQMVVTTKTLAKPISEQLPGVEVLAEPQARNTAPCVFWAAQVIASRDPNAVMLVMPSDHYIANPKAFSDVVKCAVLWAEKSGELCTLGIQPTRPETGYGYIKTASEINESSGALRVERFVEKPNLATAETFLASGNYLWNSGMFVWTARAILNAFLEAMPEMQRAWDSVFTGKPTSTYTDPNYVLEVYPKLTSASIDVGVMEKAKKVSCFPLDCGWDDLGAWTSVESVKAALGLGHKAGSVLSGKVVSIESSGNIIDVPGKTVALLGVQDLIIAEANGALLIAKKSEAQRIREIVEVIKKKSDT